MPLLELLRPWNKSFICLLQAPLHDRQSDVPQCIMLVSLSQVSVEAVVKGNQTYKDSLVTVLAEEMPCLKELATGFSKFVDNGIAERCDTNTLISIPGSSSELI